VTGDRYAEDVKELTDPFLRRSTIGYRLSAIRAALFAVRKSEARDASVCTDFGWWLFFDINGPPYVVNETLSIKVSKELKARLRAAAKSRQTKPSTLVRQALELIISDVTAKQIAISSIGAAYYGQHLHTDLHPYCFRCTRTAEPDPARTHQRKSFSQEYVELLKRFNVPHDQRYIFPPVEPD
jgi:predicted transcriptional regulator